nr:MAG TPA: hypothetical protein [Caudoviricetes sp.]
MLHIIFSALISYHDSPTFDFFSYMLPHMSSVDNG